MRSRELRWLVAHELREVVAARSCWLLFLVIGALVGHAFITSTNLYAEASGIAGGASALASGLSPLEGIVVPTFGAYDLAATLLFPFVVIRSVAAEKQTGAIALTLQSPLPLGAAIAAKSFALLLVWFVALLPGVGALGVWLAMGGHLHASETFTVLLGHLLRGLLTIGIGAAAAALAASAASAAIVALTITLGTWAVEYVAAARGGLLGVVAAYTPGAALRVFEHGELRVATVLVLCALSFGGLWVATTALEEGRSIQSRMVRGGAVVLTMLFACVASSFVRMSVDVSEDRRNSFPRADEIALSRIASPLHIAVNLAAEDPRLVDFDRGVLAKLRRTMPRVDVAYAADGRSGLFARQGDGYGEIWYELDGRKEMSRSSTPEIVLETIYRLAKVDVPAEIAATPYAGFPLPARSPGAPWIFFGLWPVMVAGAWIGVRRTRG